MCQMLHLSDAALRIRDEQGGQGFVTGCVGREELGVMNRYFVRAADGFSTCDFSMPGTVFDPKLMLNEHVLSE